jgi:nitrogen-specific signal transduction histidine kinase
MEPRTEEIRTREEKFVEMLIKYGKMQRIARPTLPRVHTSAKLVQVIENLNRNIIPAYLNEDQDLEEVHIYTSTQWPSQQSA